MAQPNVVIALESGYLGLDGETVLVRKGDVFLKDDPLVKKFPHLFGPQGVRIEQATAAPGEKRGA